MGAGLFGPRVRRRLPARAGRAHFPLGGGPLRNRHLRAARSVDPDIADLVGSVDLSKVARVGDEGDPRAWSWSGAVYAASCGVLEMIEILKVKREFLYPLLTMTQEKNVKAARFPLIYLDETILAHTNLAEFNSLPSGEGK